MVKHTSGPLGSANQEIRAAIDAFVEGRRASRRLPSLLKRTDAMLAERGILTAPDDVFYLTADELFAPGPGAGDTVVRRRGERERLAAIRMPVAFVAPWEPEPEATPLAPGETLNGVPAAGGKARGPVRIVTPESLEDFVDLVVPILQERGVYKHDYPPGTLREKLFGQSRLLPPSHPAAAHRQPAGNIRQFR